MKLLGNTENKIMKHKNCECVKIKNVNMDFFCLGNTEIILVHCNLVNDNYQ